MRSARRLPHAETVYAALRKRILSGDLNPGTPLREEELGRTHQVSRTPVREALTRLESEGLAARDPRNGLIVSRPSLDEIVDLYVLREALEGLAANLVAERRTELDIARLELLVKAAEDGIQAGDTTRWIRMSTEFHSLMWRLSGNRPLQHALADVHEAVERLPPSSLSHPGRADQSAQEHAQLLRAIRDRDPIAAERIAREHVRNARNTRLALSIEYDDSTGNLVVD